VTLGQNINSLRIQRELADSTARVSTTFERLSSGQRINRASDDAAGLSISNTLSTNARVYTQGVRNLNDGLSLINVADGALEQLTDITIRLKELAEQSSNGIFGPQQRKSIDAEAQALSSEFTRIVRSTKFNGRLLFDDEFGKLTLQAGFGTDGGITSGLGGAVGNGTFQGTFTIAGVAGNTAVGSGDFNGDGYDDIVQSSAAGAAYIALSNGDGTFRAPVGYFTSITPAFFEVNDLNNDGIKDLVASIATTSVVLLGNGNGTFKSAGSYSSGSYAETRDLNGDGIPDIIAGRTNSLVVLIGNGDGSFKARVNYGNGVGNNVGDIAVEDYNGDGILDAAFGNSANSSLRIVLGNGDGTFRNGMNAVLPGVSLANAVEAGDFNGDGQLDLIWSVSGSPQLGVLIGNGDGTFSATVTLQTFGTSIADVQAGDFNGDGLLDVIASDYNNGNLNILFGAGNGSFTSAGSRGFTSNIDNFALGDFNGDGVYDVTVGDSSVNRAFAALGTAVDGIGPLKKFSLKTRGESLDALTEFDKVLRRLTLQRGAIGAFSSRLQTASAVTTSTAENYLAARSRILDADIAFESSELVRSQILQKSAQAVLAQANQESGLAIKLLQS